MIKLKHCPFCGHQSPQWWENKTFGWYVRCPGCGSRTDFCGSKGAATKKWNRRTKDDG